MRTLARAATSSLVMLGAALALMMVAVAAVGILGTRAATGQGNEIAGDELTSAVVTGQLGRSMDAAYAAGLAAVQASVPAERSRLLGSLYANLLPAVDAQLVTLDQLHADDPPAELDDARTDHADADAGAVRAIALIGGAAALGLALGGVFLVRGIRHIRASLEPSQDQAEFADTLQIAGDEDEAHGLLQRHLERTLPASGSPTPPSTWPSGRAGTASSWPIPRPRPPFPWPPSPRPPCPQPTAPPR